MIDVCDGIYFLRDWTRSQGAIKEMGYAIAIRIIISRLGGYMREDIEKELDRVREKIAMELMEGKDIIIKRSKLGIKVQVLKVKNIK